MDMNMVAVHAPLAADLLAAPVGRQAAMHRVGEGSGRPAVRAVWLRARSAICQDASRRRICQRSVERAGGRRPEPAEGMQLPWQQHVEERPVRAR
jgi:hypothetical protein